MKPTPLDIMATHVAIVGKTGSGKTYTAKGLVERLLEANRKVIVLDPTGAWWGLRSKADGRPGFPIPVLGGEHGDLPLAEGDAEKVAEWLVSKGASAVIDLSELLLSQRHRFVEHFGEAIYRTNRASLHLVVDEADEFMPQNPMPECRRMLGNMDRIVRRGRIKGFRVTLITQRPAVLHKNVLTQANTLIAMKLMSPQDRKAIEAWIQGQGDEKAGREVLNTLARLKRGEGWVWAPELELLERRQFPAITTFDSSRAPEEGEVVDEPAAAALDVGELRALLAADEEDDEVYRADGRKVEIARAADEALRAEYQRGYDQGLTDGRRQSHRAGWEAGIYEFERKIHEFGLAVLGQEPPPFDPGKNPVSPPAETPAPAADLVVTVCNAQEPSLARGPGSKLSKAERLILTALAQYPNGRTVTQVAILTAYAKNGGGFRNALGALRSRGCVTGSSEHLVITPAGLKELGPYDRLPHGRKLLEHWLAQLSKAERKILESLVETYPRSLSAAQIANRSGYEADGGGFRNALGRLRSLELIRGRGEIKASEALFG